MDDKLLSEATFDDLVGELGRRSICAVVGVVQEVRSKGKQQQNVVTDFRGPFVHCMGLFRAGMIRMESEFHALKEDQRSNKTRPGGEDTNEQ